MGKLLLVLFFSGSALASHTDLTASERRQVDDSIRRFYRSDAPAAVMSERPPKVSVRTGQVVHPNRPLRLKGAASSPLLELAQAKATASYQDRQCRQVLRKRFPALQCGKRAAYAAIEDGDQVAELSDGWVNRAELAFDLDGVPVKGQTDWDVWSDDWWRTRWGGLSYRYGSGIEYEHYQEAVDAYTQPKKWRKLQDELDAKRLSRRITNWSPAEKYDLTVGDGQFALTNQQKELGLDFLDEDGEVEDWMGICDGWAAASLMVPRPKAPVERPARGGATVTWYPNDIKALASLLWANADYDTNFAGFKCEIEDPKTLPNGRIEDQTCFDTNPGAFHLALGNLIGKKGLSFIMDATFDYEIWNQPLESYKFTYFNPLKPQTRSQNWKDVAVPYDDEFKAADRFQKPLTRGRRKEDGGRDDSAIRKIVGVEATVVYLSEVTPPDHTEEAYGDDLDRVTYTYDLELAEDSGKLVVTGGEWHENGHPDFLWIPRKGEQAQSEFDTEDVLFPKSGKPSQEFSLQARKASQAGYPLRAVVDGLVNQANEE